MIFLSLFREIKRREGLIRMTKVYNLANDDTYCYSLPPEEAVKAAYLQNECNNYNTWEYDEIELPMIHGKQTIACGDYVALREGESV